MDLKYLYELSINKNILERYNLPYNFFTSPHKVLTEETCLNEILDILSTKHLSFPNEDSSDLIEFIENKTMDEMEECYSKVEVNEKLKHVKVPYIKNTTNQFIKLLCFIRAYASNTYKGKGCFKEYFKDVFDIFYNPLLLW
jgi:hypothetical protein